MKKPKKQTEPAADPHEEPTNPTRTADDAAGSAADDAAGGDLASDFDEGEDTAVTAAPIELLRNSARPDDWDGPTHEAEAAELAALAAASTAENGGEPGAEPELPEAAPPARLESVIESLLFASDRPLPVGDLKRLVGERGSAKVVEALEGLRARRDQEGSGIQVVEVAGGWHLRTRHDNVNWVSRLVAGRPQRLTRAMLETLSIVAYRQPITRPEIDDVRGVDCGPVLKTLLDRGLVRMIGKKEEVGRPILYGTTPEVLRIFSLRDLGELPTLREFHELGAAEMAKVDAEAPLTADKGGEAGETGDKLPAPAPVAARQLDPEEDDELLTELERAAAAAAKAADATEVTTAPPAPEPAAEDAPQTTTE